MPPTAERRAQVQILRTLGIIGTDQVISAEAMKAYDGVFAAPLSHAVLTAIAALVGRVLPADPSKSMEPPPRCTSGEVTGECRASAASLSRRRS